MTDQRPESADLLNPFWLEHGGQIRAVRKTIDTPKTAVGERIQKDVFFNPIFMVYNRLNPIFSSLVALAEYDEIGKSEGKSYFSEATNQGIVLRALKLVVEDSINSPYLEVERSKYEDYREFFGGILSRLGQLGEQIQLGAKLPNFINSLAMIFSQEVNELKGVQNFDLNIEKVRKLIADDLPKLAQMDDGKILFEIKAQLETPLVNISPASGAK